MFYITKKESETGKKFQQIVEKRDIAINSQRELAKKYGFSEFRPAYWSVWGGFSSCIGFKETPNKKIWGKGAEKGEFYPKKNSKLGKEIATEFEEMPIVGIDDLNQCIGFKGYPFKTIGFASSDSGFFGFVTDKSWNVKIPKDCEEIIETRYDEIFNKK